MIEKIFLFLILLLGLGKNVHSETGCNPDLAKQYFAQSNFDKAYSLLESCIQVKNLPADTYGQLAHLIASGYGKYPSQAERAESAFRLFIKSAAYGSNDGLTSLISYFREGESILNLKSDAGVVNCLRQLESTRGMSRKGGVYACLPSQYAQSAE